MSSVGKESLVSEPSLNLGLDLRAWLKRAEAMGEVQVVTGADWREEVGAISQVNIRKPGHKALLFDEIKGYPKGYRLLTNAMTNASRLGLSLRLGEGMNHEQVLAAVDGKPLQWEEAAKDYQVQYVDDGPVQENVLGPDQYDLFKFPVPLWHQHDGGRYIGTGVAVITQDPETGSFNAGAYRMMVHPDGKTLTLHILGGRHGMMNIEAWFAREGRCPIVASFGHDPLVFALAGSDLAHGMDELAYAGAIAGVPLQAVRGVTGMPIPATSEIVVEGWIYPDQLVQDGPFGEWHGHYSGLRRNGEAIERLDFKVDVQRVYHRNDPILLGTPPGRPPHDFTYYRSVLKSAMIKDALIRVGVPGIQKVWVYEPSGARVFMVVSVKQAYLGHARQAGYLALEVPAGYLAAKWCIVVDEDIDPSDMDQVIWALCFRCQPDGDIDILRKSLGDKGDVTVELQLPYSSRAVIDACIPLEKRETSWMVCEVREGLEAEVKERWAHLWE